MFTNDLSTVAANVAIPLLLEDEADGVCAAAIAAFRQGDYLNSLSGICEAAEQGMAVAQYCLGVLYDNGLGVPQDQATAARWYRAAAEQGHVDAQFNLGNMYRCGHGVRQMHAEAVRWYRAAADQGDPYAQFNLGIMYQYGDGDLRDVPFAYMWLKLALSLIPPGKDRENVLKALQNTAENMTPDELEEAGLLETEWWDVHGDLIRRRLDHRTVARCLNPLESRQISGVRPRPNPMRKSV